MPKLKKKILVIEDDKDLLDLYVLRLRQAGFEVREAKNGDEGLTLTLSSLPDLILLDILLPKVDGYAMLRSVKTNPKTKKIPVIIFSNLSQKQEIEKGFKLGADDFIIKTTVTPTELVNKVKQFLSLKCKGK